MERHGRHDTLWLVSFAALLASLALLVLPNPARAADLQSSPAPALAAAPLPYFVRLGVGAAIADTTIVTRLGGVPVAGGGGSIGTEPAAYVEAGAYITNAFAVSLAGGYPPTFTTKGTGTLQPFGTLYRAVVGLPVLEATYHLDLFGPVRPYAGVGIGYAIVFHNEAAAVTSPRLRDRAAFVLVGGIDYALTAQWGLFVDVKKAFLSQPFTGFATPFPLAPKVPVTASVRTDPILVSAGASYRF